MKFENIKKNRTTAIVMQSKKIIAEKTGKQPKKNRLSLKLLPVQPNVHIALPWQGKSPRERLHLRARELAVLAGHALNAITQSDYEQAKREVTGETIISRQNAVLDAVT